MRLSRSAVDALAMLPPDGAWMTLRDRRGVLRPPGVTLAAWTRANTSYVPDAFWKPEFDEGDGRGGRTWIVFDDIRREPFDMKSRRYRLTRAGIALLAHCAAGGKLPRQ